MSYRVITAPQVEPVTLEEARAHLRVVDTSEDMLIQGLIVAAREYAQTQTRRALITQTLRLTLDSFPGPSLMGVPYGRAYSLPRHAIALEYGPVQEVVSIQYTDMGGVTQTMPATDYVAVLDSEPVRITPVFGKIWPINLPQIGSVRVTFRAGYGDSEVEVPAGIRQWMLLRIGTLYENREQFAPGQRLSEVSASFIDSLLDPYRIVLA